MNDFKRPIWHYFILIFLACLLLRLPLLWIPVIDVDESIYALFAKVWFSGGIPYIDTVETKPLGIYLLFGLTFKLFGPFNMTAVHVVTILLVFLTSYVLYLTVRLFGSARGGLLAALFYSVFTTTYTPKVIATTIEPIMMLPISLNIYLWLKFEDRKDTKYAFLSGLSLSAAILLKYQAGINLILILIYVFLLYPIFLNELSTRTRIKGLLYFMIGLVPLPALMIVYLKQIGALDGFLFWTILGSLTYIHQGSAAIDILRQLLTRVLPFIVATTLLWILLSSRIKDLIKSLHEHKAANRQWLILFWLLISIVPLATGKRFYGHYFVLLVPPLAILAGHQLDIWWGPQRSKLAKGLVVIGILIPALGCLAPRFFLDKTYKAFGEDNPNDYKPIADYISEHTSPDDRIAVWGFAPLIYWYSERLPATRFLWSDLLAGRVPAYKPKSGESYKKMCASPLIWKMFLDDIEKNKPIYFIDMSPAGLHDYEHFPMSDYPLLERYINVNYRMENSINDAVVYIRK